MSAVVLRESMCPRLTECGCILSLGSLPPFGHYFLDLCGRARPAGAALMAAIVFVRDQPLVPAQYCLRRYDSRQIGQNFPFECLRPGD